jgi:hypothetical protein
LGRVRAPIREALCKDECIVPESQHVSGAIPWHAHKSDTPSGASYDEAPVGLVERGPKRVSSSAGFEPTIEDAGTTQMLAPSPRRA